MTGGIDGRLGQELGLEGRYAAMPAYQIVNETHDLLLAVSSRLIGLRHGPYSQPRLTPSQWSAIGAAQARLAARLRTSKADGVQAAKLSDDIRRLDAEITAALDRARRPGPRP